MISRSRRSHSSAACVVSWPRNASWRCKLGISALVLRLVDCLLTEGEYAGKFVILAASTAAPASSTSPLLAWYTANTVPGGHERVVSSQELCSGLKVAGLPSLLSGSLVESWRPLLIMASVSEGMLKGMSLSRLRSLC